MGILSKNNIETWILPHLIVGSRGFDPTVPMNEIIEAINYRLKTGCQWREMPTKEFFSDKVPIGVILYFITLINGQSQAVGLKSG
jgi:hypothetical protein